MALSEFEIVLSDEVFTDLMLTAEKDLHADSMPALRPSEWATRFIRANGETNTVSVIFTRKAVA